MTRIGLSLLAVCLLCTPARANWDEEQSADETKPTTRMPSFISNGFSSVTSIFKSKGSEQTLISALQPKSYEVSSLAIGVEKDLAQKRGQGYALVASRELEVYLENIRRRLSDNTGISGIPGKVKVRATSDLAASATADGNIFIGLSWLIYAQSEDEIAAIIAHELSHILLGHFNADIVTNVQDRINSMGEMGVVLKTAAEKNQLASKNDQQLLQRLQLLKDITDIVALPAWGRKQEREADLLAIDLLAKAGYSPSAMITVHEKLEEWEKAHAQSEQESGRQILALLQQDTGSAIKGLLQKAFGANHPDPANRILDSAEYIQKYYEDNDRSVDQSGWRKIASLKTVRTVLANYDKAFSAEIYLAKNDWSNAFKSAQQAVSGITHSDAYPNWVLGRAADAIGQPKIARKAYARAIQAGDPPKGLYEDAIAFEESSGKLDKAIVLAEKAQAEYGDAPTWYPTRIRLYHKANKKNEASVLVFKCMADAPGLRKICQEANQ